SRKMRLKLGVGFMNRLKRPAGKFELAAGLERNPCPGLRIIETYDMRPVGDRGPAKFFLHPLEKRANSALTKGRQAAVRNRRIAAAVERDLLVLRADPELIWRFRSGLDPCNELAARHNGGRIRNVARHFRTFC